MENINIQNSNVSGKAAVAMVALVGAGMLTEFVLGTAFGRKLSKDKAYAEGFEDGVVMGKLVRDKEIVDRVTGKNKAKKKKEDKKEETK